MWRNAAAAGAPMSRGAQSRAAIAARQFWHPWTVACLPPSSLANAASIASSAADHRRGALHVRLSLRRRVRGIARDIFAVLRQRRDRFGDRGFVVECRGVFPRFRE